MLQSKMQRGYTLLDLEDDLLCNILDHLSVVHGIRACLPACRRLERVWRAWYPFRAILERHWQGIGKERIVHEFMTSMYKVIPVN